MDSPNSVNSRYSDKDLENVDLSFKDLSGTKFDNSSVKNTRFFCSNLQEADFTQAKFVNTEQFSGANLAYCAFSEELSFDALDIINDLADRVWATFVTLALVCLYSFLAIGSTTDVDLMLNGSTVFFPLIEMSLPTVGFYNVAPILVTIIAIAFHLQLLQVWNKIISLPSVFPDGVQILSKLSPSLLTNMVEFYSPHLDNQTIGNKAHKVKLVLTTVFIFSMPPITLICYWISYLKRQDFLGSAFHLCLLFIVVCHVLHLWKKIRNHFELPSKKKNYYLHTACSTLIFFGLVSFSAINHHTSWLGKYGFHIDASRQTISEVEIEDGDLQKREKINISGQNLRKVDLYKSVLENSDLSNINFTYANLRHAELNASNISGSQFNYANLSHGKFSKCVASHGYFYETKLVGANLNACMLERAHFWQANLEDVQLKSANLSRSTFVRATMDNLDANGASFKMAIINGSTLNKAQLENSNFYLADLVDSHFWKSVLNNSELILAELMNSDFTQAFIKNSNFTQSNIEDSVFIHANLTESVFSASKISQTDFAYANLCRSNFKYAQLYKNNFYKVNLANADFSKAWLKYNNFGGVDLSNVKGLSKDFLANNCIDEDTILPDYLALDSNKLLAKKCHVEFNECPLELEECKTSYALAMAKSRDTQSEVCQ